MKFLSVKILTFAVLLPVLGFTGSGCSKIKTLVAKKQPGATPAATISPVAGGDTTHPADPVPAVAAPGATPMKVAAPAINRNSAVMVLCYHRLEEKPRPKDPLAMTPQEFEKQMQALKDNNFSVIPMQDFLAWRRGDKNIPAKCAVVTIDDGYVSGYDTAWPILKKFGYPFTMFVYVNYIGSGGKSVSWDQLAEMRDAGVDIESHTYSHADLHSPNDRTAVDKHTYELIQKDVQTLGVDGWLSKEILGSKQVLEKQLGIKVNAFAYPFGKWNQKVLELVKGAGYEAAFTVYGQRLGSGGDPFRLGRYAVDQNNPKIFQDALSMTGGGQGGAPPLDSAIAQMASASMITQPMSGETISNPKPLIKANLATMGEIEPASVKLRVSGIGAVVPQYDATTKTLSYQVTQPLTEKNYSVIVTATIGGKPVETRWDFNYDPNKAGGSPTASKPPAKP